MKQHTEAKRLRSWRTLPVYAGEHVDSTRSYFRHPLTFHLSAYNSLGPLYRMRFFYRMHLVMAGPDASEFIWRHSELWDYKKRQALFRESFDETNIMQLEGEAHRQKRRRMVGGFKPSALPPHVPAMNRIIERQIAALPEGLVDLRELCQNCAVATAGQVLVQADLPTTMAPMMDAYASSLLTGNSLGPLRHLWYRRPAHRHLKQTLFEMVRTLLVAHENTPHAFQDVVSCIREAHAHDHVELKEQEMIYDFLFLVQGGTKTTANIVLWALLFSYSRPEWLAALREELAAHPYEQFVSASQWPKLMATVYEAERLRPPEPFYTLLAGSAFEYQGIHVPKGTRVFHAASLSHFLPELYEDPFEFKPERFSAYSCSPHRSHSTYGGGRHVCLGQSFARMSMLLILAQFITNFDLVFEGMPSLQPRMGGVLTPEEHSLPVRLVPRQPATHLIH